MGHLRCRITRIAVGPMPQIIAILKVPATPSLHGNGCGAILTIGS